MLQRLPGLVAEHRRGELIRILREARDLTVEIRIGAAPVVAIHIRDPLISRCSG